MKRLLILLTLLPQLLVLGLGTGVVVCVGAGGHLQIEVAAGDCCSDTSAASLEAVSNGAWGASGHGFCTTSCTDLGIVVDTRLSRAPDGPDIETGVSAALPVESSTLFGRGLPVFVAQRGSQDNFEPPHLLHLRSVLLRC